MTKDLCIWHHKIKLNYAYFLMIDAFKKQNDFYVRTLIHDVKLSHPLNRFKLVALCNGTGHEMVWLFSVDCEMFSRNSF